MSAVPESAAGPVPGRVATERALPLLRGALAIVLGLVITFSSDHSAAFGLVVFSVFALATGAVLLVGGLLRLRHGAAPTSPVLGGIALVAGLAALMLPEAAFVGIVAAWALLSGAIELLAGIRLQRSGGRGRDAVILGAFSLLLGLVLLIVPPDYVQPWQVMGDSGVEISGAVTADVMNVGILGAWAVIHGLLLVIAAFTPKSAAAEGSR